MSDLLPAGTPARIALDEMSRHFGSSSGLSQVVIVFERPESPLTETDLRQIEEWTRTLSPAGDPGGVFTGVTLRTPKSLAYLGKRNPLASPDGKAALVFLYLPCNYITKQAARIVNVTRASLEAYPFAPGLNIAVTGFAGYGRDYMLANERSHRKVMGVTLVAVVVILLLVYRAPLAAAIPLLAIGIASVITMSLLDLLQSLGLGSGTAERIFVFVLLYGAGVDYSLLYISRCREFLDEGCSPAEAAARGLDASLVAVLSSAATTTAGLATLYFAQFVFFHNTGPAVAIALMTAAAASVTLVPAMVALAGGRIFWPFRRRLPVAQANEAANGGPPAPAARWQPWPALARLVTGRPLGVFAATTAALALASCLAIHLTWLYDSQTSLKPTYDSIRGSHMVQRHWPIGEMFPVELAVVYREPQSAAAMDSASDRLLEALRSLPSVDNIRGVSRPLGSHVSAIENGLILVLGRSRVRSEFVSPDRMAMRMYVILKMHALTAKAMNGLEEIRAVAKETLRKENIAAEVHLAGPTADMVDLRTVTQGDFRLVAIASLSVIFVILVALLRDLILSLFLVAATVLSYVATLGLTCRAFGLLGQAGLDWKVEVFLFIVMVAVGQDYNIFFAVRLAQETRRGPLAQATERALVHTGPVISSCGVIMAATLGSVMVGDVTLFVQLGFALALGMLIDTFLVRPLLLPSFILLTRRTLRRAAGFMG